MERAVTPRRPQSKGLRITFTVVTVLLALLTGFGIGGFLALVGGWFPDEEAHNIHDIGWGILTGVIFSVAYFAQLRQPESKVAALQQVAVAAVAMLVASLAVGELGPLAVVPLALVAIFWGLHPARSELLSTGPVSRPLAGLALLGAVPLVVYALGQFALQRGAAPGDPHAELEHYGGMGAIALAILAVGLVASMRAPGWRIPAWCAGLGLATFGAASLALPNAASAARTGWALAAVVGGLAFVGLAERESRMAASVAHDDGPQRPAGGDLHPNAP